MLDKRLGGVLTQDLPKEICVFNANTPVILTHEGQPGMEPSMDGHGIGERVPRRHFGLKTRHDELLE